MAAARKRGNPNAKRGMARLQTGAAIDRTIKTGIVAVPAVIVTAEVVKKHADKKVADQKKAGVCEAKDCQGAASKEEIQAAAKSRERSDTKRPKSS